MALTQINTRSLSGTLTASQYPIASNDLPAGAILQTIVQAPATLAAYNSTTAKLLQCDLVTKGLNSHFLLECSVSYGSPSTDLNNDSHDVSFAFGQKLTSAADTTVTKVSGQPTNTRHNFAGTQMTTGSAWYQTDVPFNPNRSATHGGAYDTMNQQHSFLDTTRSFAIGTAVSYSLWMYCQTNFYFNRVRYSVDNCATSYLILREIKA